MKFASKLLAFAVCVAALTPAMAQDKKSSIQFMGDVTVPEIGDPSGSATVGYGYLFSPKLEVGVFVSTRFSENSTFTFVGGSVQYYFKPIGKPGQTNFYVKGSAASGSMSTTTTGPFGGTFSSTFLTFGGFGGIAYNMTESAEAFAEVGPESFMSSGSSGATYQGKLNFGLKFRF